MPCCTRRCPRLCDCGSKRRHRTLRDRQQARYARHRRLLSHTERELASRPLRQVHQALLWSGHEEPEQLHTVAGGSFGGDDASRRNSSLVTLHRGGQMSAITVECRPVVRPLDRVISGGKRKCAAGSKNACCVRSVSGGNNSRVWPAYLVECAASRLVRRWRLEIRAPALLPRTRKQVPQRALQAVNQTQKLRRIAAPEMKVITVPGKKFT